LGGLPDASDHHIKAKGTQCDGLSTQKFTMMGTLVLKNDTHDEDMKKKKQNSK